VQALAADQRLEPLELLEVLPARHVRVVLPVQAVVVRVGEHLLALPGDPLRLELEGALEGLGLVAAGQLVVVAGVGPLDRVAQHDEELDAGQVAGDPLPGQRVEQVVRARLVRQRPAPEPTGP
jgi:hypothetical protein